MIPVSGPVLMLTSRKGGSRDPALPLISDYRERDFHLPVPAGYKVVHFAPVTYYSLMGLWLHERPWAQNDIKMRKASFTASGATTSAFGRDTLGGGHQQAGR
ncbi:hypothetical protein Bbelb_195880 [Branchiostoma belcheri]|nr:hypothetical protein Bbelb_195880 [Branchiostoma belcheri]